MMRGEDEHTIFLKDYAPSPYKIEHVELDVRIDPGMARVRASARCVALIRRTARRAITRMTRVAAA